MELEKKGHYHPLTIVQRDSERIFRGMGFSVAQGPELEDEYHNFDALNVPADHPARDMQDTFWIRMQTGADKTQKDAEKSSAFGPRGSGLVLRTQTSNVQIRYMETHEPPIRIIAPGRTFRSEATDARHEAVFHQIEGLVVDTDVTLAQLKGTLERGLSEFFGSSATIRMRPGFFPFVEPALEVDAKCFLCGGENKSCGVCKGTGWIELMGAGMVHPKVLSNVGINPRKYKGFAFGVGIERLAMVKYGVPDIRMFLSGDLRVTEQF